MSQSGANRCVVWTSPYVVPPLFFPFLNICFFLQPQHRTTLSHISLSYPLSLTLSITFSPNCLCLVEWKPLYFPISNSFFHSPEYRENMVSFKTVHEKFPYYRSVNNDSILHSLLRFRYRSGHGVKYTYLVLFSSLSSTPLFFL